VSHQNLEPLAAKTLLEGPDGWIHVDIRTEEEFAAGHAAGAWNIPFLVTGPGGRRVPNPEFLPVLRGLFPSDARLVLG
jgi:rhodanese-related sulfurtransferase